MVNEIVRTEIGKNKRLKGLLAAEFQVGTKTIENWLAQSNKNHLMLTTDKALQIITQELGLTSKEVLEKSLTAAV